MPRAASKGAGRPRLPHGRVMRGFSALCAAGTAALGAAGLVGWMFGVDGFLRVSSRFVTMVPITGVALVCLGTSVLAFELRYRGRRTRRTWLALTLVPLGIGAIALIERTLGPSTLIGSLLFADRLETTSASAGGRPALGTATALVLIATALLLPQRGRKNKIAATVCLAVAAAIASIALNAYSLVPAEEIYQAGPFADMALHTSAALVLAVLGVVSAGGPRGLARLLTRETAGGRMARRVVPALLLMPAATSAIVHAGATSGVYSEGLERSLSVVAVTAAITFFFWSAAARLDRADTGRVVAERLASIDTLTGLANRRRLERQLAAADAAARDAGEPYALVALDADGLKRVNDTLGHDTGDRVLRAIGEALTSTLRPFDTAARLGGDEFVVLLTGVTEREASQVAGRITADLNDRMRDPNFGGASVSSGVASWSSGLGPQAVLAAADRQLYEAKRARQARVAGPVSR